MNESKPNTHLACPECKEYCAICGVWLDPARRTKRAPEMCNVCREHRAENDS